MNTEKEVEAIEMTYEIEKTYDECIKILNRINRRISDKS